MHECVHACAGMQATKQPRAAYIVMAHVVVAHAVMAHVVMASTVMACIVMAYTDMAWIVVACKVMAYIVMRVRRQAATSGASIPPPSHVRCIPRP